MLAFNWPGELAERIFRQNTYFNGDAVVQFEDSNLQQHYTNDNGWLITYSYPFNDELIIGQGLHESTTYAGYLHTFEDKDKVRMWNDILDFVFRSDFQEILFYGGDKDTSQVDGCRAAQQIGFSFGSIAGGAVFLAREDKDHPTVGLV